MNTPGADIPAETPLPESRFTAPTALCPRPDWWTSTDGDSTEREVAEMLYGLVRGLQPDGVLETGTAFGEVADFISRGLRKNRHGKLWTIEVDAERAALAAKRLSFVPTVEIVIGDSRSWEPPSGVIFDLCFFDSWFPYRVPEFRHYRPFMRLGTIVCFHDTAPGHGANQFPGSDIRSQIVRELRRELRLTHLPTPRGLTIGEVI